jgi:flagellar basal-body rod modification protein FlgD
MEGIAATSSTTQAQGASAPGSILGKDDFLKLLVAQLKHQDPLNPMEDKDFMGQMAQFSSLEQLTNLSQAIGRLGFSSQVAQSVALIGRTVDYVVGSELRSGAVDSVAIVEGEIRVHVGGDEIAPADIRSVRGGGQGTSEAVVNAAAPSEPPPADAAEGGSAQ